MAWTFIASANNAASVSGTTLDCSSSLNVAAGDLLVAWGKYEGANGTFAIAKNSGSPANTFTLATETNHSNGDLNATFAYVLSAAADATATFRLTTSSRPYRGFIVMQFRPDAGETVAMAAENTGSGTSANPNYLCLSGNITISGSDLVALGAFAQYADVALTLHEINNVAADAIVTAGTTDCSMWYRILTSGFTGAADVTQQNFEFAWITNAIAFSSTSSATAPPGKRATTPPHAASSGASVVRPATAALLAALATAPISAGQRSVLAPPAPSETPRSWTRSAALEPMPIGARLVLRPDNAEQPRSVVRGYVPETAEALPPGARVVQRPPDPDGGIAVTVESRPEAVAAAEALPPGARLIRGPDSPEEPRGRVWAYIPPEVAAEALPPGARALGRVAEPDGGIAVSVSSRPSADQVTPDTRPAFAAARTREPEPSTPTPRAWISVYTPPVVPDVLPPGRGRVQPAPESASPGQSWRFWYTFETSQIAQRVRTVFPPAGEAIPSRARGFTPETIPDVLPPGARSATPQPAPLPTITITRETRPEVAIVPDVLPPGAVWTTVPPEASALRSWARGPEQPAPEALPPGSVWTRVPEDATGLRSRSWSPNQPIAEALPPGHRAQSAPVTPAELASTIRAYVPPITPDVLPPGQRAVARPAPADGLSSWAHVRPLDVIVVVSDPDYTLIISVAGTHALAVGASGTSAVASASGGTHPILTTIVGGSATGA